MKDFKCYDADKLDFDKLDPGTELVAADEVLYSSPLHPDATDARQVLAFLLVPERIFMGPQDDDEALVAVRELLDESKREALLNWYAHHVRSPR